MFELNKIFVDKYNRQYKAVERIERTAENGEKYFLYNLYPPHIQPKKSKHTTACGFTFTYEPYLYLTEEALSTIFLRYL